MTPAPTGGTMQTALWLLRAGLWPVPISPPDDARAPSPGKSPIGRAGARSVPPSPGSAQSTVAVRTPGSE